MQTMDAALAALVQDGTITRDLAMSRAGTESELRRLLDRDGRVVSGSAPSLAGAR
jgi:hypothetical protein